MIEQQPFVYMLPSQFERFKLIPTSELYGMGICWTHATFDTNDGFGTCYKVFIDRSPKKKKYWDSWPTLSMELGIWVGIQITENS